MDNIDRMVTSDVYISSYSNFGILLGLLHKYGVNIFSSTRMNLYEDIDNVVVLEDMMAREDSINTETVESFNKIMCQQYFYCGFQKLKGCPKQHGPVGI